MMIFQQLGVWRRGGSPEEKRKTVLESRSLDDGSTWVHVTLKHNFESNKFQVDREVVIKPEENEQEYLATLLTMMFAEYEAALTTSREMLSPGSGNSQTVPAAE